MGLVEGALVRYWDTVRETFPGGGLPPLDDRLAGCLSAAAIAVHELPDYRGTRLRLLDLARNPEAPSVKSAGALVTVAHAAARVRATGQPVTLLAPSSGNGATALRDAVLRAHRYGLAAPDRLRAVCLVPARSRYKLRRSPLCEPPLGRRNPVVVYHGSDPGGVAGLARAYREQYARELRATYGGALWLVSGRTGDRAAGAARALLERDELPEPGPYGRVHAQAVDSGAGLLGHHDGTLRLPGGHPPPRYLLVQHLNTPDLVLHALFGSCSRAPMPRYAYDPERRLHRQEADPRFPGAARSPDEVLDPTFFTRVPDTASELSAVVRAGGGGGCVVSAQECLDRYTTVRALLGAAGIRLPAAPDEVREWALPMALTGVLCAVDRGLLGPGTPEVLVHGTGCAGVRDSAPLPDSGLRYADSVWELDTVVAQALAPDSSRAPEAGRAA
ncbi:DUF6002 family protein [Streptomyces boncukensis]|uniref:Pyridoxal-phosphate dependent enzyme n=1 Tax=Streptomyces boncukensis TaxID=2711219 RepID=A0A6G4WVY2_9ACTN|nr:DUF6002 family protein [Streptomyces boncukensis]NGO69268.1 hypothetical protein [Streptomyces boncukensis]